MCHGGCLHTITTCLVCRVAMHHEPHQPFAFFDVFPFKWRLLVVFAGT
jgi:hypothetical protein